MQKPMMCYICNDVINWTSTKSGAEKGTCACYPNYRWDAIVGPGDPMVRIIMDQDDSHKNMKKGPQHVI